MIQAFGIKVNETRATQGNISKASFQFVFLKLHKMNKSFKKKGNRIRKYNYYWTIDLTLIEIIISNHFEKKRNVSRIPPNYGGKCTRDYVSNVLELKKFGTTSKDKTGRAFFWEIFLDKASGLI